MQCGTLYQLRESYRMNNKMFAWLLFFIILTDSIVTAHIQEETNPIVLWQMGIFNLTLNQYLFWKVVLSGVAIWFLSGQHSYIKLTTYAYIGMYTLLVGFQFLLLGMR